MSTADDDVLATDGGPDDANARAELAVLDMALGERFGDRAPRDLWPGTAARLLRARSAAPARRQPWLLAAGMLLGLGVVTAIALWRPTPTPTPTAPPELPQDPAATQPALPASIAELKARLATATEMRLQAKAVWSPPLGRWVAVSNRKTGSWLQPVTSIDPNLVAAIRVALGGARQVGNPNPEAAAPPWSHQLTMDSELPVLLMVRVGGEQAPAIAFQTPTGTAFLEVPAFPFEALAPAAARAAARAIAETGLVLGAQGFATLPTTTKQLLLHDVPTNAIGELERFSALQELDLTAAPAWHEATVLESLASRSLDQLYLAPRLLDAAAFRALGTLTSLRKLGLADSSVIDQVVARRPNPPAPALDDGALQQLSGLDRLFELALAGGTFTDVGLRALSKQPIELLALLDCERFSGESLAGLPLVRELVLKDGRLGAAAAGQIAAMPSLKKLYLIGDAATLPLAPLAAATRLTDLILIGPLLRSDLPELARLQTLEHLLLIPESALSDPVLMHLTGLRNLKRLSLPLSTIEQRAMLQAALPATTIVDTAW